MNVLEYVKEKIEPYGELLYLTTHGSHLYGTNTPESDKDYVGIFLAKPEYYLGFKNVEEVDLSIVDKDEDGRNTKDAVDIKVYELKKFLHLLMQVNPNIVDLYFSWTNARVVLYNNGVMNVFFNHPEWFLNKRILKSFYGYAKSQLKKGRNKPENFKNLLKFQEFLKAKNPDDVLGAYKNELKEQGYKVDEKFVQVSNLTFPFNFFVKKVLRMVEEKLESASHRRKQWLEKGYDAKFFLHLVRLLDEVKELCENKKLVFPLKNREFYLEIRSGKFTLEELEEMMEQKFEEFKELEQKCDLPSKANVKRVEEEFMKIVKEHICKGDK